MAKGKGSKKSPRPGSPDGSGPSPEAVKAAQWARAQWAEMVDSAAQKQAALETELFNGDTIKVDAYRVRRQAGLSRARAVTEDKGAAAGNISVPTLLLSPRATISTPSSSAFITSVSALRDGSIPMMLPLDADPPPRPTPKTVPKAAPAALSDDCNDVDAIIKEMKAQGRGPPSRGAYPTVAWPNSARVPPRITKGSSSQTPAAPA